VAATVLAGDLGGTKCRFALVSADFGVHCVQHVPTVRDRAPFLGEFDRAITERAHSEIGPAPSGAWTVGALAATALGSEPGSSTARTILADAESAACALVANAATLLNPSAIVLGGGVMSAWPGLRERIAAHVRLATSPLIHGELLFADSLGGSDAILWGAAAATGSLWQASR